MAKKKDDDTADGVGQNYVVNWSSFGAGYTKGNVIPHHIVKLSGDPDMWIQEGAISPTDDAVNVNLILPPPGEDTEKTEVMEVNKHLTGELTRSKNAHETTAKQLDGERERIASLTNALAGHTTEVDRLKKALKEKDAELHEAKAELDKAHKSQPKK